MIIIEQYGDGLAAWYNIRYNGVMILHNIKKSDVTDIIKAAQKSKTRYKIIKAY